MKWLMALLLASSATLAAPDATVDALSKDYIRLSLAMGAHDSNYVDAYYGPAQLQEQALKTPLALPDIKAKAMALQAALDKLPLPADGSMDGLRLEFLKKQTTAMRGRIDLLQGRNMSFDQESAVLYDTVAPHHDRSHFEAIIKQIDALIPLAIHHPARQAESGVRRRHSRLPRTDPETHQLARRRGFHAGVRHRQAVERL
jgi:hypothetical protein